MATTSGKVSRKTASKDVCEFELSLAVRDLKNHCTEILHVYYVLFPFELACLIYCYVLAFLDLISAFFQDFLAGAAVPDFLPGSFQDFLAGAAVPDFLPGSFQDFLAGAAVPDFLPGSFQDFLAGAAVPDFLPGSFQDFLAGAAVQNRI